MCLPFFIKIAYEFSYHFNNGGNGDKRDSSHFSAWRNQGKISDI